MKNGKLFHLQRKTFHESNILGSRGPKTRGFERPFAGKRVFLVVWLCAGIFVGCAGALRWRRKCVPCPKETVGDDAQVKHHSFSLLLWAADSVRGDG